MSEENVFVDNTTNWSEPMKDKGLTEEQLNRALALAMAKPLLKGGPFSVPDVEDLIRLADWILVGGPKQRTYPFTEGDVQVLGPSVIAMANGEVINWLGVNYIPDDEDPDSQDPETEGE